MSHERMLKAEAQLEKEIKELMRKAEILDAQEDSKYGKGKLGSDLPKELQRRQDRLAKIFQARKAMEAEAAAAAARDRAKPATAAEAAAADADAEKQADASEQHKLRKKADRSRQKAEAARDLAIEKAGEAGLEPEGLEPQAADAMPQRGLAHRADGSPKASAQRNFTDPDSHIMKSDGNLLQGYNCQAAVDGDHQVIVAMGVSNQPPDVEHLEPMLESTIANTGACPETFITVGAGFFEAVAGYWIENNVHTCEKRGAAPPHISTGRQKHGQPPPPICGPIPKGLDAKGKMARKLRKKEGREIYAKRKTIVEPVFGQTKEARGLRRFLLRGLEKVNSEWTIWGMTHNLNKLWRYLKRQRCQEAMATG
jgi:hypothetical protein